jgi:hypothetical protein
MLIKGLSNKYETHIKAYYTHYALSTHYQAHIKSLSNAPSLLQKLFFDGRLVATDNVNPVSERV